MDAAGGRSAERLRERLRAVPADVRKANQAFSIRLWRGLSWLERAEEAADLEGRFISLWIAFNAIYGYLLDDGVNAPDHASWQEFLAGIVQVDTAGRLEEILWAAQLDVLRLVECRYLYRPFWQGQADADDKLAAARRRVMVHLQQRQVVGVLQELFERLYVLRQQVFHGAATRGSRLNRSVLARATGLLEKILPAMMEAMLDAGPQHDWGEVCFPPLPAGAPPCPRRP